MAAACFIEYSNQYTVAFGTLYGPSFSLYTSSYQVIKGQHCHVVFYGAKINKYVRLRGQTYIHLHMPIRYVHTPRDFTNGASLA